MIKKALMLIAMLLIVAIVGVYSYFDIMVKRAIEIYGSDILGVKVLVGDVSTSLKSGTISIGGIHIANPPGFRGGVMFEMEHVRMTLDIRSLISPVVRIYDIHVKRPALVYEFGPYGDNISVFKSYVHSHDVHASKGSLAKNSTKKKVIISSFRIENGHATASLAQLAIKSVILPNIYLSNIGAAQGGVSFEQAATEIADEVVRVIKQMKLNSILKHLDKLPLDAAETLRTTGLEGAVGATETVGSAGVEGIKGTTGAVGEVLKNLF